MKQQREFDEAAELLHRFGNWQLFWIADVQTLEDRLATWLKFFRNRPRCSSLDNLLANLFQWEHPAASSSSLDRFSGRSLGRQFFFFFLAAISPQFASLSAFIRSTPGEALECSGKSTSSQLATWPIFPGSWASISRWVFIHLTLVPRVDLQPLALEWLCHARRELFAPKLQHFLSFKYIEI